VVVVVAVIWLVAVGLAAFAQAQGCL